MTLSDRELSQIEIDYLDGLPETELHSLRGGMQEGMEKVIRQLLPQQSPETVATLTNLPLKTILAIKNNAEH